MTVNELLKYFNETYGLNQWPTMYQVDAKTYANVCQFIFSEARLSDRDRYVKVFLGPNRGILFKNVELYFDAKL